MEQCLYHCCIPFSHTGLYLYEQPHWANMRVAGSGNVPTGRAGIVPAYLQRDFVPPVRKQGLKAVAGVDTIAVQQQAGMGIAVCGSGEF